MTGPDLIRLVIEGNLSENKERRTAAIRAFITNQFNIEQHVKFKQVDLDNRLLDLFIDVPIGPGSGARWQQAQRYRYYSNDFVEDSGCKIMSQTSMMMLLTIRALPTCEEPEAWARCRNRSLNAVVRKRISFRGPRRCARPGKVHDHTIRLPSSPNAAVK